MTDQKKAPLPPVVPTEREQFAAERERQRIAHLVLGAPRPRRKLTSKRKKTKAPIVALAPGIEERVQLREAWSHKQGAPETHQNVMVALRREGALARLHRSGAIDQHQLAAAERIVAAHEQVTAAVSVRTAKLTPRGSGGGPNAASAERIGAIILERNYTAWRDAAGSHAAMLLAIIVDDMGLNHAADADPPRSERRPAYRPLPRKQVSRPRRHRVDVPVLADLVAYAAEPAQKRASLHAFLIGSLCTIARPDSVVDICVAPEREQWYPGSDTLDLNPFGRAQTNKYRPTIPVVPVLAEWLLAELASYQKLDVSARKGAGYLGNYYGRSVLDVDTSWATMLRNLKLPSGREWKPYLLRHSLATILRNRGVAKWDLEGFMGHDAGGTTEVYAIGRFETVRRALEDVLGEIDLRAPGVLRRNCAEVALSGQARGDLKMTG